MKLTQKNIVILCCSLAVIYAVTFSARFITYIGAPVFKIVSKVILNLLNELIAQIAMKLAGMKVSLDLKNKYQYRTGVMIAPVLSVVLAIIPALCGFSLVGNHIDFSGFILIYDLFFYMLIIGPVEEHKWLGVVIASFLFGLWHIINGNVVQVLFTFGIGLVFGFAKYKIKGCGYVGVSVAHGLYDFLNTIVRMLIV